MATAWKAGICPPLYFFEGLIFSVPPGIWSYRFPAYQSWARLPQLICTLMCRQFRSTTVTITVHNVNILVHRVPLAPGRKTKHDESAREKRRSGRSKRSKKRMTRGSSKTPKWRLWWASGASGVARNSEYISSLTCRINFASILFQSPRNSAKSLRTRTSR